MEFAEQLGTTLNALNDSTVPFNLSETGQYILPFKALQLKFTIYTTKNLSTVHFRARERKIDNDII